MRLSNNLRILLWLLYLWYTKNKINKKKWCQLEIKSHFLQYQIMLLFMQRCKRGTINLQLSKLESQFSQTFLFFISFNNFRFAFLNEFNVFLQCSPVFPLQAWFLCFEVWQQITCVSLIQVGHVSTWSKILNIYNIVIVPLIFKQILP